MKKTVSVILSASALFAASTMGATGCGDDDDTTATSGSTTTTTTTSGTGGQGAGGMGAGGAADPDLDCATYCDIVVTNCNGDDEQYVNTASCMDVCSHFTPGQNGTGATATGENTLGCRIYHGNAPAAADPATHCTHSGPAGDDQCGSPCESFCALNGSVCGFGADANAQYADNDACLAACVAMDMTDRFNGSNDASSTTNEYSCYLYHLTAAASDPGTHCPHTNTAIGGPCNSL